MQIEICQPPRWTGATLGLTACDRALMIITRYDNPRRHNPVALTVAALRMDLFDITIATPGAFELISDLGLWSHAMEDGES